MESQTPKLESILSSPEELGKLVEAAKKLIIPDSTVSADEPTPQLDVSSLGSGFLPGLNLSPKIINAVSSAARTLNEREKRVDLLYALKPLVKNKSGDTIDRAATAMKLARAVRVAINGFGSGDKLV